MKKSIKILVAALAVLVLAAVAVIGYGFIEIRAVGRKSGEVTVEIPQGAGASIIGKVLQENGVIGNALVFRLYTYGKFYDFQYGTFTLDPSDGYAALIEDLQQMQARRDTVTLTVPEGTEVREIVDMLVELELGSKEEIKQIINTYEFDFPLLSQMPTNTEYRLEGYLFPDTYQIYKDATEENIVSIIQRMLDNFQSKTSDLQTQASGDFQDIIILASIIEREGQKAEELPLVSSVFHNRINQGIKLESCATVQYILEERKPVLSWADTEIDNPYNTYMYQGLTPGPIANPGLAAIEAAMNPATSDYLFFVANNDGSHLFGRTYQEHLKNIEAVS